MNSAKGFTVKRSLSQTFFSKKKFLESQNISSFEHSMVVLVWKALRKIESNCFLKDKSWIEASGIPSIENDSKTPDSQQNISHESTYVDKVKMSDLKIIKIIDKLRVNFKKLLVFDSTTFKDHSQLLNLLENPEILTKPNPSAFNSLKQSNSEEKLTNQKIVFLPSKTKSPEAKFLTNNERVNED